MLEQKIARYCKEYCPSAVAMDGWVPSVSYTHLTKEDIREIADCGQVLGDYANNPRVATIPEMYELLMSCYDRK